MTTYNVALTNGWGVYTSDPGVLESFRKGDPVITIPSLLMSGGDGSVYHVSIDHVVCIRELRRCPASTRA